MENPKTSAVARIKEANNVLVTVSSNPSVDQLAGAIGLTLLLNKLGKHATAVFSGNIPSTIEFLQPEATLEKNTDSLRDFIIALDKAKADKLRYKVEDKLVKIFITPYRTSIDQSDLEFSHGDFNVDVVVALGVHEQEDLDQAITAHGRILHDATILSVNTKSAGGLGSISWVDDKASSLCEMLTDLGAALKSDVFDAQMATALMTGIVAETERFSNEKTTSVTMSVSAKLMAAGANQQLVATKLQEDIPPSHSLATQEPHPDGEASDMPEDNDKKDKDSGDGSLQINHPGGDDDKGDGDKSGGAAPAEEAPAADEPPSPEPAPSEEPKDESTHGHSVLPDTPKIILDPPSIGGAMSAVNMGDDDAPMIDPLSLPPVQTPILSHDSGPATHDPEPPQPVSTAPEPAPAPPPADEPPAPAPEPPAEAADPQTLDDLEHAVESSHIEPDVPAPTVNELDLAELNKARDAVTQAVATGNTADEGLEPIAALGAQPVDLDFGHGDTAAAAVPVAPTAPAQDYFDISKLDESTGLPADATGASVENPTAPPPVPPPLMPPTALSSGEQPLPNAENDNQAQDPTIPL